MTITNVSNGHRQMSPSFHSSLLISSIHLGSSQSFLSNWIFWNFTISFHSGGEQMMNEGFMACFVTIVQLRFMQWHKTWFVVFILDGRVDLSQHNHSTFAWHDKGTCIVSSVTRWYLHPSKMAFLEQTYTRSSDRQRFILCWRVQEGAGKEGDSDETNSNCCENVNHY